MSAYVIFDVDISDMVKYQEFMTGVKPALEKASARYLARIRFMKATGRPAGIVLLESPSTEAFESFYHGDTYRSLKAIRDACSSARLVSVEGLSARRYSGRERSERGQYRNVKPRSAWRGDTSTNVRGGARRETIASAPGRLLRALP